MNLVISKNPEPEKNSLVSGLLIFYFVQYIYSGERYDFRLSRRSFGQQHFKFWVETTDTLDQFNRPNELEFSKHHTLGIVSYSDEEILPDQIAPETDFCNPCLILNCPFAEHPSPKFRCVHLTKLKAEKPGKAEVLQATNVVQKFYEFHFEDANDTVNGIQFMMPHHPPFMHAGNLDHAITRCPNADCGIHDAYDKN